MQDLLMQQHHKVIEQEEETDKDFFDFVRYLLGDETHQFHKPNDKHEIRPAIYPYLLNHRNSVYINFQKYFNKLIVAKANELENGAFTPVDIPEGRYIGFYTHISTQSHFNIIFREFCRLVGTVKQFRITNIIKNKSTKNNKQNETEKSSEEEHKNNDEETNDEANETIEVN